MIDGVTYNIVCDEPAAVNDKATLSTDAQVAERTYLEKDYPEGTFAKSGIAEAIAKAKEVAQKEKVTKLEIKEADDALKKALGKLDEVKASGKTEVQTKIAQAAEKKEADYTKESWANFAKAKRDAEMAFASETATAKQLKDAADALDIAMKALEAKKIFGGIDLSKDFPELGQSALFCVTEIHTLEDIDNLVQALKEVC